MERIARQQEKERETAKKNWKKDYEDFMKLLTFVQLVEEDDFWRSEVVQITARTASSGALELELTPRSGRFAILFGRPEDAERKFDKLLRFYRSGLSSVGWDAYRTVDVRYRNQVVCKK
ncbi:cell division protein FtsQ [human gut metagenome]|uniref:Cell division protein FtsQ n=1 Tax=human gut metagenome TaxID=408170 RepID=K1T8Z5_9ZZZZ